MTDTEFREQEIQIARYRCLEREVTNPLAAQLLHTIIEELEADLQRNCGIAMSEHHGGR